jgi:MFS family permease
VATGQRPRSHQPAARARLSWAARLTGRARTSPYYPPLSHPVLRRILPATAASALGDGMSAVAIAWLALQLALPVHVAVDLHGSAALLGAFWAVFGVGAVIGELAAPFLRRWRVWPTMTAIVLGWGLALAPLGLPGPLWVALAAFFAGAVIWGPWMSLSMAVFQDASPPHALAQVIAARGSLLILAAPLGTALGGPLVAALGACATLLASALGTIVLGLITAAVLAAARRRAPAAGTAGPQRQPERPRADAPRA